MIVIKETQFLFLKNCTYIFMYTPKIMICENYLRKTGVILKMG